MGGRGFFPRGFLVVMFGLHQLNSARLNRSVGEYCAIHRDPFHLTFTASKTSQLLPLLYFLSFSLPPTTTHQPALPAKFPTVQSIQVDPTNGYENAVCFFIGARLECLIHRLHDRSLSCKLFLFAFAFG